MRAGERRGGGGPTKVVDVDAVGPELVLHPDGHELADELGLGAELGRAEAAHKQARRDGKSQSIGHRGEQDGRPGRSGRATKGDELEKRREGPTRGEDASLEPELVKEGVGHRPEGRQPVAGRVLEELLDERDGVGIGCFDGRTAAVGRRIEEEGGVSESTQRGKPGGNEKRAEGNPLRGRKTLLNGWGRIWGNLCSMYCRRAGGERQRDGSA